MDESDDVDTDWQDLMLRDGYVNSHDVSCFQCGGKGCRLCKGTGWIEVLGAGVVNKKVLENCGIDSEKYSGFAFGLGLERIAMLKYGINNIKMLFESDLRVLDQIDD